MATRNYVPRVDGEGLVGTPSKKWGGVNAVNLNATNLNNRDVASDQEQIDTNKQNIVTANSAINTLKEQVITLEHAYAGPLVASTVAAMTDQTKVYVYTGSETGYTAGNWYYYNGSSWVSGGVYNSTALETDKTLTVSGAAADAKVVGDTVGRPHYISTWDTSITDLNDVTTTGTYTLPYATSYDNCPVGANNYRHLHVESYVGGAYIFQTLIHYSQSFSVYKIYRRMRPLPANSWGGWTLVYDMQDVNNKFSKIGYLHFVSGLDNSITDLDNATTTGTYGLSYSASYDNCPVGANNYRLLYVESYSNGVWIYQTLIHYSQDFTLFKVYRRLRTLPSNPWGAWNLVYDMNIMTGVNTIPQLLDKTILSDSLTTAVRKGSANIGDVVNHVTWESGNLSNTDGTEIANGNYIRSEFLPVSEGDSFVVKYQNSPLYRVRFYYYDSNESFTGYSFDTSSFGGNNPDVEVSPGTGYIRFTVYKTPVDTIPIGISDVSNIDFTLIRTSYNNTAAIRVGTHNVRNWGTEYSIGYTGDFNNNFDFYVRLYGSKNLDILGMQEFSPMLDATYQHPASQLLSKFFNKMYLAKDGILVPTATNIQISNFEYNKFTTNRWYTTGTITLSNGQSVKVVNVHASPGSGSASARATEYAYLVSILQNEDYFIITGDFNAVDVSEYAPFVNAGFNLANGGNFGTFNTCFAAADTWYPCDNIITSSKMSIVSVEMAGDRGTSDHKLLVADIICNKW